MHRKAHITTQDRLRQALRSVGLTQAEIADRIGVKLRTLRNYLAGTTSPDVHVLESLCREFHIAPNWIVLGKGEAFIKQNGTTPDFDAIEDSFKDLDPRRQRILKDFSNLLGQLQKIDRMQDWMLGAVGRGRIPLSYVQFVWQITEMEWSLIKEFVEVEKTVLESEPIRLTTTDREGSQHQVETDALAARKAKEAEKNLGKKIKKLAALWHAAPKLDQRKYPFVGDL